MYFKTYAINNHKENCCSDSANEFIEFSLKQYIFLEKKEQINKDGDEIDRVGKRQWRN